MILDYRSQNDASFEQIHGSLWMPSKKAMIVLAGLATCLVTACMTPNSINPDSEERAEAPSVTEEARAPKAAENGATNPNEPVADGDVEAARAAAIEAAYAQMVPNRDADYESRIVYLWRDVELPYRAPLPLPEETLPIEDEAFRKIVEGLANPFIVNGPFLVDYTIAEASGGANPAFVIAPGGGYRFRSEKSEGLKIAEWLNQNGISAFVLNYRLDPHPAPIQDARLAIAHLRKNAEQFNIDPDRIGIIGFSAGGHLAATASTLYDHDALPPMPPHLSEVSSRPDITILAYPVITFSEPHVHQGSREEIAGGDPTTSLIEMLSAEAWVDSDTPPAFIWTSITDKVVDYQNSELYAAALEEAGVEYKLNLYEDGLHGRGLSQDQMHLKDWPDHALEWLREQRFLDQSTPEKAIE